MNLAMNKTGIGYIIFNIQKNAELFSAFSWFYNPDAFMAQTDYILIKRYVFRYTRKIIGA